MPIQFPPPVRDRPFSRPLKPAFVNPANRPLTNRRRYDRVLGRTSIASLVLDGRRGDAVRIKTTTGGVVVHLDYLGTLPGIKILAAAGRNGPGKGDLRITGSAGRYLSWKAPGSAYWGSVVYIFADGDYLLEDGADPDKWLRVQAYMAFMLFAPQSVRVHLRDVYNNAVAQADVTAAQAAVGNVLAYVLTVANDAAYPIFNVKAWLDPTVEGFGELNIGADGAVWVQPTSETHADVVLLGDIVSGQADALHVRRTIGAAAASDPDVINHLIFSWEVIE